MKKERNIAYWVATGLLCFCLSGGIGQLFQVKQIVDGFAPLHYPLYFLSVIGFWKTMAIIAILVPGFPLLKEWAYAGVFFVMTGAAFSQMMAGSPAFHIIAPLMIAGLAVASWYLRPPSRRIVSLA